MENVINIFNLTAGYAVSITFRFGKTIYVCASSKIAESIAEKWRKNFNDAIVDVVVFHSTDKLNEL